MFLLKLPFRVAALPVILALTVFQFITSLLVGLSSIVTNLLGTLGIATAACIWMFHLGTDTDASDACPGYLLHLAAPCSGVDRQQSR